jgi:hypothetical protein
MLSKSSPNRVFGGKSAAGTVTVLETKVHRSSARKAKMAFYLTAIIVGLLAATVASDRMHPILALFVGAAIGTPVGAIAWVLVRVWPVIRLIWWWLPEIGLAVTAVYGWTALARHTPAVGRLVVLVLVLGVPAIVGPARRRIVALAWCLIVRHRLRTCFAQFITANQAGTLPLIGIARPTPVGERVHIYLRPGLSLADLESRLDKLAVGCHAATVTVERASAANAARVRIDVKRREVLDATVASPLVDLVDELDPATAVTAPTLSLVPTALDLPDITTPAGKPAPTQRDNGNGRKPAPATTANGNGGGSGATDADDINQWI